MKKTTIYALALLMISTVSCSKEDDFSINEDLLGVWYHTKDYQDLGQDQTRTTEWSFRDNGTMEIVSIESKKSTKEFLGYSIMNKGNYSIDDGVLFMKNVQGSSYNYDGDNYLDDATYLTDKEDFLFGEETGWFSNRASVSFRKRKRELVLTYLECNDTGDCVGSETLTRKE